MSETPDLAGPSHRIGAPPPLYPPAAVPAPQEPADPDDDPTGAAPPDAAEEVGLPESWPILPPVD